ncbi:hypothetical protein [Gemmatimonas sp.]|uniref:hypothetical protein n=1 Tax=Gemmatimonas sp. TaxID=1962908 RepID=UPI0039832FC7
MSPAAKISVLGDAAIAAELIVPANVVGMPDVTQMLFFPVDRMDTRCFDDTVAARGALRRACDGLAFGTIVEAQGTFRYMPKLASVGVKSRRLIELDYDPTSGITVKSALEANSVAQHAGVVGQRSRRRIDDMA